MKKGVKIEKYGNFPSISLLAHPKENASIEGEK